MTTPPAGVAEIADLVLRGERSAESVARGCLDRIRELEPVVRAWAYCEEDNVIEQARDLDRALAAGRAGGPLYGVPIGIKDIVDTAGIPTEYGCGVYAGRVPQRDAWLIERLKRAGALITGKTVTAEMATFSPGPTTNPHDPARTPGGSSSGSAAAVAASMVPGAVGSQTNGSMIRPASFCGIHGFKPSYGLIPRHGVLEQSPFLDQMGVFGRSVDDVALLAQAIIGSHPDDPATGPPRPAPPLAATCAGTPEAPPRLAFVRTAAWDQADPATRAGIESLVASLRESAHEVQQPAHFDEAWTWHKLINEADIAAHYGPRFERCMDRISESLQGQIRRGTEVSAVAYLQARAGRRTLNDWLDTVFERCDALITPAATGEAPLSLDHTGNPVFCTIWTLAGTPALSLPLLRGENGLPIGVQLIGRRGDDARLLRTARWLERVLEAGKSD